ncbi:MAG: hypothetical protein ACLVJK_01810 [Alistipes putredinis]
MKNYLYILCAFLLAFAGCTKDADVEPIAPAPDGNTQVVLTGFSGRGTRTGFGGAETEPFVPLERRRLHLGTQCPKRSHRRRRQPERHSFSNPSKRPTTYDVFYNLTGPAARSSPDSGRADTSRQPEG